MKRKTFLKSLVGVGVGSMGSLAVGPVLTAPPARAVPLVGGRGLVSNARNLASYVQSNYPGVTSIGGVRPDPLPDHPSGHAIDIMIGSNMSLGDAIKNDIQNQSDRFGVKYILWRVNQHYDHIHVTVY